MSRVLYVTYDGLLDPLGQSQVVPIVQALAKAGHQMSVLSFEKTVRPRFPEEFAQLKRDMETAGIQWKAFRYHKRFSVLATITDLLRATIWLFLRGHAFDLIHLRSYPLGPGVWLFGRTMNVPFLFDMRGLWVQERIDGGLWRDQTPLVRIARFWERRLLRDAAAVITLTRSSLKSEVFDYVHERSRVYVIPTLVDFENFPKRADTPNLEPLRLVYHGSLGTWYDSAALLKSADAVRDAGGTLTILTNDLNHPVAEELLAAGCHVDSCPHSEIPGRLAAMDAAIFFIRPLPSKLASAPTKLGEALACGLPIITGPGIGDVQALLEDSHVGVVCDPTDIETLRAAICETRRMLRESDLRDRCRDIAIRNFGLDEIATQYVQIYARIVGEGK